VPGPSVILRHNGLMAALTMQYRTDTHIANCKLSSSCSNDVQDPQSISTMLGYSGISNNNSSSCITITNMNVIKQQTRLISSQLSLLVGVMILLGLLLHLMLFAHYLSDIALPLMFVKLIYN